MKSKKWIKIFLIFFLILVVFQSFLSSLTNPYLTMQTDNYYSQEPNQNFLKVKYILENKNKYDSFIFGSSRVGKIDPKLFKHNKCYNMTYSEGVPYEHLLNIKLFLKEGVKIKNIFIGLDDFSYEVNPVQHFQDVMRKPHYLASGESILNFYSLYKNLSYSHFFTKRNNYYDINNTGMPLVPKKVTNYIETHKEAHNLDTKFLKPTHYEGNRINDTIITIKEIIKLSKENNINIVFFINPIHKITYLDSNFKNFQNFKKELSKITPYYDFSGLNSITKNNYYYYETSHYRLIVGKLIAARILNDTSINVPKDFGVFVTKDNIEAHLMNLRIQREKYRITHPKDIAEIEALKKK
jgi:hypothetical protein